MKKYKVTIFIFGKQYKTEINANSPQEAENKAKRAIISKIKIQSELIETDPNVEYLKGMFGMN